MYHHEVGWMGLYELRLLDLREEHGGRGRGCLIWRLFFCEEYVRPRSIVLDEFYLALYCIVQFRKGIYEDL